MSEQVKREEVLQQAVQLLREYWDDVQILVLTKDNDASADTLFFASGQGNIYARIQAAREFIIREEEKTRAEVRKQQSE